MQTFCIKVFQEFLVFLLDAIKQTGSSAVNTNMTGRKFIHFEEFVHLYLVPVMNKYYQPECALATMQFCVCTFVLVCACIFHALLQS